LFSQGNFLKLNGKHVNTSLIVASGDHWKRIRFGFKGTFDLSER